MTRRAARLQGYLRLCLGVALLALSLLAMHQLSVDHTVATSSMSVVDAHPAAEGHHGESGHDQDISPASVGPGSQACPDCLEHHAMVLTCLAALALLVGAFLFRGPRVRRLAQAGWATTTPNAITPVRRSRARTCLELSVCRT